MENKNVVLIMGLAIAILIGCLVMVTDAKNKAEVSDTLTTMKLSDVSNALTSMTLDRDAIRSESARKKGELRHTTMLHQGEIRKLHSEISLLKSELVPANKTWLVIKEPEPEVELTDREKLNKLQKDSLAEHKGEIKVRFDRHEENRLDEREHRQQVEVNRSRPYGRRSYPRGTVQQRQYRSGGG